MSSEIARREAAWQARWKETGVAEARRIPGHPKYFLVFAYPGTSGFMHVGHMRGYALADVAARYRRMTGAQVFFPAGIHASGLPAVTFASQVARRDPSTLEGLHQWGVSEERLPELEDPEKAARFLGETYRRVWERFGLLLEPRAYLTTVDPDYQQFIRWQFARLHRLGLLVQKPYFASFCPRHGPVSVDSSETDISRGGNAETVTYVTVAFPLEDGRSLLTATLRPETVYGVTNLWVPSEGSLQEWRFEDRTYLASPSGVSKLIDQVGGERGETLPTSTLIGREVRVPLTSRSVPIDPSPLVDPAVGSGVVMSVPAHAPADWVAAEALGGAEGARIQREAPELLELPLSQLSPSDRPFFEGPGPPAARIARALGLHDLTDPEKLQEATERTYRCEFGQGRMTVPELSGLSVPAAREKVRERLLTHREAFELREFSEPVVCRCGEEVTIRRIPRQWFLAYGQKPWKAETHALLSRMDVRPPEYAEELKGILDWYDDRPCVRKGRWLGTPFPLEPDWVIEPIADSTLYPAYYVVRRYVSEGRLPTAALTEAFFDHVFLGEGPGEPSLPAALQQEIRDEFLYWYPLDLNVGGKEHKRVHFPVFLFNHASLLPPEVQPRGILVNWWITSAPGKKLSKKEAKGGAVPSVDEALEGWGADALRLYYAQAATLYQDVLWDPAAPAHSSQRCLRILAGLQELTSGAGSPEPAALRAGPLERWLSSALHDVIARTTEAYEAHDFRAVAELVTVEVPRILERYRERGGRSAPDLREAARAWTLLLAPLTPHLAEEAFAVHGQGLAALARFPRAEDFPLEKPALLRERHLQELEEDLSALQKAWKGPVEGLRIFVAAEWKYELEGRIARLGKELSTVDRKELFRRLLEAPEVAPARAAAGPYLAALLPAGRPALPPTEPVPRAEEISALEEARDYLSRRLGGLPVEVVPEEEGASVDPKRRRERARPGRPALYLWASGPGAGGAGSDTPSAR
jgi:leucyl-tRNA synthetase